MFSRQFDRKRKAEFHDILIGSSSRRLNSMTFRSEKRSTLKHCETNVTTDTDITDYEYEKTTTSYDRKDHSESHFIQDFSHEPEDESQSESDFDLPELAELAEFSDFDFDVLAYIKTLDFKLQKWAIKNNIRLQALSELLKILKERGHNSLPMDARTLLKTPANVEIVAMGSGQYWYGGLRKKLIQICERKNYCSALELTFHIDGTPVYKSSKSEFWPIQCSVKNVDMQAFFVAIYQGMSKPRSEEEFMRPLLDEIHYLLTNGLADVTMNGEKFTRQIRIDKFILDAPARAFLKCIIGHSGYYSCEKCEERGEFLYKVPKHANAKKIKNSGHVCLIGTNAPLRTDESFRKQENEAHHHDNSPLEELPIDMVRDIPLENLHLILYGGMKRLLSLWIDGTKHFKFTKADILQISKKHEQAGSTKPSEINRQNRSLSCLSYWKATEFRTFLLKTGPVVLSGHLTEELYNHFLALHCAVTICCSESLKSYVPIAKLLFKAFTEKFGDLYGNENYTYSVHSLIHVTDDVERFGVLDNYSAFPGESNLGFLKNLVRSGHLPLQQVVRRIAERDLCEEICEFEKQDIEKEGLHKGIFRMKGLRIDSSEKNGWILTKNKDIFKITHFCERGKVKMYGDTLLKENQENLYDSPIASKNLFIYQSKLDSTPSCIEIEDIFCKLYQITVSAEKSAFMPLLHFTRE